MYQESTLNADPFFHDVLRHTPVSAVLDSLTGVISRRHMIAYIQDQIRRKTPFAVGLIDLDNFKNYNDNYGHMIGDKVLQITADHLITYVGSRGFVGRFGGDEFLVIAFIGNEYRAVHDFYQNMFNQGDVFSQQYVFRRNIQVNDLKLFISATIGSACFPKDASDYESLFKLVDKTLYRGKFKGRNCYIIYVPEKHEHLEIPSLARRSLYDTFIAMAEGYRQGGDALDKLYRAYLPMHQNMHFHQLILVSPRGECMDVETRQPLGVCEDLTTLLSDRCFACRDLQELAAFPSLLSMLYRLGQHSVLMMSIGPREEKRGVLLLLPEPHTLHIWQDEEFAAGFVLSQWGTGEKQLI